jgi:hypothetical protein
MKSQNRLNIYFVEADTHARTHVGRYDGGDDAVWKCDYGAGTPRPTRALHLLTVGGATL